MKELFNELAKEFADEEYAHAYMESQLVDRIAAQVFHMRKDRGWSQQVLAEKAGLSQEKISKIESADFGSLTLKTMQKLSRAFDVNLMVSFQSFSDGMIDIAKLSKETLVVQERAVDLEGFMKANKPVAFKWLPTAEIGDTVITMGAPIISSTGDAYVTS